MANATGATQLSPKELKIQKAKATRDANRLRRQNSEVKTYELKIQSDKLNPTQQHDLKTIFLEGKWFYNSVVSHIETKDLKDFKTSTKEVYVRMGKETDKYELRQLPLLPASTKQSIVKQISENLKTLSTTKARGKKVGKLNYVKSVNTLILRQFGVDFKVDFSRSKVKIPRLGWIRVRGLRQLSQNDDIAGRAILIRDVDGYFIHISVYRPKIELPYIDNNVIGFDLGITTTLTASDGMKFSTCLPVPERVKRLQRKLSRQIKGSHSYVKTLNKIGKAYKDLSNKKNNTAHQRVHELIQDKELIFIQDENISGWKTLFGKQVHHSILGRIKKILKTKDNVVILKRSVATTQFCPHCHALNKHTLGKRLYECPCGYSCDRDTHAARNMIILGIMGLKELKDNNSLKENSYVEHVSTLVERKVTSKDWDSILNRLQAEVNLCVKKLETSSVRSR